MAAFARSDGFDWYLSDVLPGLGNVALLRGDVDRAEALYREALPVAERFGDTLRLAGALVGLAAVAAAHGQAELAARRIGAAEARYEVAGTVPFRRDERVFEGAIAAARRALGEDRYRAARELGRIEAIEAIVAAPEAADPPASVGPPAAPHGLTPREVEVVRLVAAGHEQRRDRRHPLPQRAHRQAPPHQHPRQAGPPLPLRAQHLGPRPRPRLNIWRLCVLRPRS